MRSLATLATFLALAIVTSATVNAAPNSYAMSVLSVLTDPQKGMRFLEV